jgi:hypothetical protein
MRRLHCSPIRFVSVLAAALACATSSLPAQGVASIPLGSMVRIHRAGAARPTEVLVAEVRADTLWVRTRGWDLRPEPGRQRVMLTELERVEVWRSGSRARAAWRVAGWGALLGIGVGAAIGAAQADETSGMSWIAVPVIGGAGLAMGALMGAGSPGGRWELVWPPPAGSN